MLRKALINVSCAMSSASLLSCTSCDSIRINRRRYLDTSRSNACWSPPRTRSTRSSSRSRSVITGAPVSSYWCLVAARPLSFSPGCQARHRATVNPVKRSGSSPIKMFNLICVKHHWRFGGQAWNFTGHLLQSMCSFSTHCSIPEHSSRHPTAASARLPTRHRNCSCSKSARIRGSPQRSLSVHWHTRPIYS